MTASAAVIEFDETITDYQPVISNAIFEAAANDVITLGEGVFLLGSPLKVNKKITLQGDGNGGTVLKSTFLCEAKGSVVYVSDGATLDHLAITGGRFTGGWGCTGVGVYLGHGTLSYCSITNNTYNGAGNAFAAGIYVKPASWNTTRITHCRICDNIATASYNNIPGAGVYVADVGYAHFIMDNCLVAGNQSKKGSNSASWLGGGIYLGSPSSGYTYLLANCTIVDNYQHNRGGGLALKGSGVAPQVINCIIANNSVDNDPCIYAPDVSATTLTSDNDLASAFLSAAKNNLVSFGTPAFGTDGLSADPNFVSGSYYLKSGSAAIDAGIAYEGITDGLDLDGVQRDPDSIDLGCFKYVPSTEFEMSVEVGTVVAFNDERVAVTVSHSNVPEGKTPVDYCYVTDGENDYPIDLTDGKVVITRPGTWRVKVVCKSGEETLGEETSGTEIKVGVRKAYVTSDQSGEAIFPYGDRNHAAKCLNDVVSLCIDGTDVELDEGVHTVTGTCSFQCGAHVHGQGRDLTWVNGAKKSVFYLNHKDFLLDNLSVTNYARNTGAAVSIASAGGNVRDCRFADNWLGTSSYGWNCEGLTIYCQSPNTVIDRCIFERIKYTLDDNMCNGIALSLVNGKARNCVFRKIEMSDGKVCDYIVNIGTGAQLDNCTFVGCTVKAISGRLDNYGIPCGIFCANNATIRNCLFGAAALGEGSAAGLDLWWAPIVQKNGDYSVIDHCCVEGTTTYGVNPIDGTNIRFSPMVDYEIGLQSSCRNAGMLCDWMDGDSLDILGRPRIVSRRPDVGAAECQRRPGSVIIFR